MPEPKLRILIADDHDIVRQGTCAVIEREAGWEVCGIAKTAREAVELAATFKPDVVVKDMSTSDLAWMRGARSSAGFPRRRDRYVHRARNDDLIRQVFKAGVKSSINKLKRTLISSKRLNRFPAISRFSRTRFLRFSFRTSAIGLRADTITPAASA